MSKPPWTCLGWMRLKQKKIQESNFIFTALPLIETSLSLSVYCIVTPNPTRPDDTKPNLISLGIFTFNTSEWRDQIPLNLRRKVEGQSEERSVSRVEPMTFSSCEFVNVLHQGWYWIELWEATLCTQLWCVQQGEGEQGQKKKGGEQLCSCWRGRMSAPIRCSRWAF